jgi:hypothetical protein
MNARIYLVALCLTALLTGLAVADDPATTKESFEHQLDYRAGMFPGMIPDPENRGQMMSVEGQFDHPNETKALLKIQLLPYNGEGYIENGVQKYHRTPLEPAYPPKKNVINLGQETRNTTSLGLVHELNCTPENFNGVSTRALETFPVGKH